MALALEHIASREVHEAIAFVLLALVGLHLGGVASTTLARQGCLHRIMQASVYLHKVRA